MLLPSDNWCSQRYFVTKYENQGQTEIASNYSQAFIEDTELSSVISRIGELLSSKGYSIKDAEQEMKNVRSRQQEDGLTSSINGSEFRESPLDIIKRRVKADIIIQVEWSITSSTLSFILEAFDSYTSKRIATSTAIETLSSQPIPIQLQNAVNKHIKPFDKQLSEHFRDIQANGREIVITLRTWDNWDYTLDSDFNDDELLNHVQLWLKLNTVNGNFNLTDASENFAQFEQVRIPIKDKNGMELDARSFTRLLQKHLSKQPLGIPSKLMMRGLGEAILVLGEK